MRKTQAWSLHREDPLEKGMATYASILTWRIPWTRSLAVHWVSESDTTETLTLSLFQALQTLPAHSLLCCPAMVSPPEFFDISAASPSSCLQDKLPKTAETFIFWALGREDLIIKVPAFTEYFLLLYARVGPSHAIMALVVSSSMGKKLMKISSCNMWVLVPCPWQTLAPRQTVSSFLHALSRPSGWKTTTKACSLWQAESMNIVEAMECFESRNGKTWKKITIADCVQIS